MIKLVGINYKFEQIQKQTTSSKPWTRKESEDIAQTQEDGMQQARS